MRRGRGPRAPRRAEAARRAASPRTRSSASASGARRRPRPGSPTRTSSASSTARSGRARRTSRWSWSTGRRSRSSCSERGPLPPNIAVGLTEQILRALGYAHRRGIVHRDVKPQNVILDPEGQAKVADFGIARVGNSRDDPDGRDRRHGPVHLARAGRGPPGRPPLGPLLDRAGALRAADRPAAVRRRGAGLDRPQAHQRAARSRPASCGPGIPPALEAVVMRVAGEGPGAALPERGGVHRGARAGARASRRARS